MAAAAPKRVNGYVRVSRMSDMDSESYIPSRVQRYPSGLMRTRT